MNNIYFYKSTNAKDGVGIITIFSSSAKRAFGLALMNFIKNGYKGSPVRISL